ncbi:hypothetical protein [Thiocapsa roseopersicina]|uniref:Uncharacterized protein n=1 Tax=Thiocapsa roseopersicina TaxID=1058 RepID=A0A1H2YL44_THIRO|nr:hypothetical protein [Thiocapsa roseopersicina]SDX05800.1 hypothetical protein SAMN05421783_11364 [Thiocapsa roseopersicina]
MATIEEVEMGRYAQELEDDVRHLVRKYCRIMAWDIPDLDEKAARGLILAALRASVTRVESE